MSQPPKRKRNKEKTIKRILLCTDKMIKERGYAKVTTNAIAEKAGVNISLIYKYFPNGKPDLLMSIFDQLYHKFIDDAQNLRFNLQELSLRDFLKSLITQHRKYAPLMMGLAEAYFSDPDLFKNVRDVFGGGHQVYSIIGKIITDLGCPEDNLNYVTRMLYHVIDSLIHRQVYENMLGTDDELINFLVDLIVKYIKAISINL